jgi:cell division protein FtsQ
MAALRRAPAPSRLELERLIPSTRSLIAGAALLVGGLVAFGVARQSSLFAVRTVDVRGASPALERQVRAALAPLVGTNLVSLEGDAVRRRLADLPQVRGATFDRAFPNTLRVWIRPDPEVAVLRSGQEAWLVSANGAIIRKLRRPLPRLPHIWVERGAAPTRATAAVAGQVLTAVRGAAEARRARSTLWPELRKVRADVGVLTFALRSGIELRLGAVRDVALKLAVAAEVLRALPGRERQRLAYLDLSVPGWPVAGTKQSSSS